MSMTTTSASCLSATPRATVAPTLPAPPTTVTLRFMSAPEMNTKLTKTTKDLCGLCGLCGSHLGNNRVPEVRRRQLGRAFHEPREVVRDALGGNRAVHALDDEISRFDPAEVAEHHLAREDHGAGIYFVEIRVLGRGAVRRLEDRVARHVIDVPAGRDADAADLRRERVRQVVAIQVRRRDDVELVRPRQHLLQRDVGNRVLDDDAGAGLAFGNTAPRPAV